MPEKSRGVSLTIFAIAFVFIAITDFIKPFYLFPNDGFVFLGTKLTGVANVIVAPAFGAILMLYAYGIWTMRRFALPLSYLATASVVVNMVLYTMKNGATRPLPLANVILGIGVPLAAAIALSLRRAELS